MNNLDPHVKQNELVSLKVAAQITGYSSDYIGQLIRANKIAGRQVYSNIAWMTTVKAVMDYKLADSKDHNSLAYKLKIYFRKLNMELIALKLFFNTFKTILPIIFLILIITFSFIFFWGFKSQGQEIPLKPEPQNPQALFKY